jgi:hypothetical protein
MKESRGVEKRLTAGVTNLNASLTNVDRNEFSHVLRLFSILFWVRDWTRLSADADCGKVFEGCSVQSKRRGGD